VFQAVVDLGVLAVSPCQGIKLRPRVPAHRKLLTPAQAERLAGAMDTSFRPMAYTGAHLGLRRSEVAGLRAGCVDLAASTA